MRFLQENEIYNKVAVRNTIHNNMSTLVYDRICIRHDIEKIVLRSAE